MKLRELLESRTSEMEIEKIDFIGDERGIVPFNVKIKYEYIPAHEERHPYSNGTASEHFSSSVNIYSIISTEEIKQEDEDENVINTWPKGFDIMKLPGWSKDNINWFEQQALDYSE